MISMQRKAMHRKKDFDRFKTYLSFSLKAAERAFSSIMTFSSRNDCPANKTFILKVACAMMKDQVIFLGFLNSSVRNYALILLMHI